MTTLPHLIEALKKATGPDRLLDWDIASAIGWKKETRYLENANGSTEPVTLIFSPNDCGETRRELWRMARSEFLLGVFSLNERTPYFTASIDAALTLVPDGMEWDASNSYGVARVILGLTVHDAGPWDAKNSAGLIACAFSAAALKLPPDLRARQEEGS